MKMRGRLLALSGSALLGVMYMAPTTTAAAAPAKTAWWTQAHQNGATGNLANSVPFDQAPGGTDLHVSNAGCPGSNFGCKDVPNPANDTYPVGNGPTAFSAVGYDIPGGGLPLGTDGGTVIADLKLTVSGAPVDANNFKLLACKTLSNWTPVNGGDWSEKPGYRQGGCAVGVPAADGKTVGFTLVAALAGRRSIDLCLVPTFGDPTPFQVQFTSNDPQSLTFKTLPPPHTALQQPVPQPVEAYNSAVVAGGGSYAAPLGTGLTGPEQSTVAQGAPAVTSAGGRVRPTPGVGAVAATDQRIIWLLLAAILVLIASNWSARIRRLMSFERAASRGVGRFVRARTGLAQPL